MKAYNEKIRVGLDITFIVLGLLFLTGVITIPSLGFWAPWIIILIGVLLASLAEQNLKRLGLGVALFGVYLLLRTTGVIAVPILLWGLSLVFIGIGVSNLMRGRKPQTAPVDSDDK